MFLYASGHVLEDVIDSHEVRIQSFVIKVSLEDDGTDELGAWHGRITHVPSGESRYVTNMEQITSFIREYLPQTGARKQVRKELRDWIQWLRHG